MDFGWKLWLRDAVTYLKGFRFIALHTLFYKNNEAQIWPKIKNNVGTIQAGI